MMTQNANDPNNGVMTGAELYNAIGTRIKALRDEADMLEHFASNLPVTTVLPTRKDTAEKHETKSGGTSKQPLSDRIKDLIASNGGVMERKEIIKAIKAASRGKIKHIAVVATLRNHLLFKDQGNGLFSLTTGN